MVARLLHDCGVFLGPEDELSQPVPDNVEGYFENLRFVTLNDEIINQLGGTWDEPPRFISGWEFAPEIVCLRERAEELVDQFRRNSWGWKDPRNSLTLPFWQRLIPALKVVVCVRNPLEVARSLFLRGDAISPTEFELWMTYYRQLQATLSPSNRLITHYESYFENPLAELRRVLTWLNLEVPDETVERACANISASLRHHSVMTEELMSTDMPDEVLGAYLSLCAEAGPVFQQARKLQTAKYPEAAAGRANEVSVLLNELQQLRAHYAARDSTLEEILHSKAFRLVTLFWRLRRPKRVPRPT